MKTERICPRTIITRVLKSGKVPDYEFERMFEPEYSKEIFSLDCPLLAPVDGEYDSAKYYSVPFNFCGCRYAVCSKWSEKSKECLEFWADEHT